MHFQRRQGLTDLSSGLRLGSTHARRARDSRQSSQQDHLSSKQRQLALTTPSAASFFAARRVTFEGLPALSTPHCLVWFDGKRPGPAVRDLELAFQPHLVSLERRPTPPRAPIDPVPVPHTQTCARPGHPPAVGTPRPCWRHARSHAARLAHGRVPGSQSLSTAATRGPGSTASTLFFRQHRLTPCGLPTAFAATSSSISSPESLIKLLLRHLRGCVGRSERLRDASPSRGFPPPPLQSAISRKNSANSPQCRDCRWRQWRRRRSRIFIQFFQVRAR